jgi:hypothetical protein
LKNKVHRISFELNFFRILWILILLPKEYQFVVFAVFTVFLIIRNCIVKNISLRIDKVAMFMFIAVAIQITAVFWQFFIGNVGEDFSRLYAAINTNGMWLFALFSYSIVRDKKYSETEMAFVRKWFLIDLCILVCIYFFYQFTGWSEITILGQSVKLRRMDYLQTGTTERFSALTESVLGASCLFLLMVPTCLTILNKWKFFIVKAGVLSLFFLSVVETHSRAGIVACTPVFIIGLYYLWSKSAHYVNISKSLLHVLFIIVSFGLIVFVIINFNEFLNIALSFANSRSGSNSARFDIYKTSIQKVLDESPVIGIGIKYMLGSFPLGSHSTYIGLFYKSGILGIILWVFGFASLIIGLYRKFTQYIWGVTFFIINMAYFAFLMFSDIDGVNWVIMSFFIYWGLIMNNKSDFVFLQSKTNTANKFITAKGTLEK